MRIAVLAASSAVLVLQRGHRGQVVQGQVARVFDVRAEGLLRQQCGVGRGHAGFQQYGLQPFGNFANRMGIFTAQQERQHAPRLPGTRR